MIDGADFITSNFINKKEALEDLRKKDPSKIWDAAEVEKWIQSLPEACINPFLQYDLNMAYTRGKIAGIKECTKKLHEANERLRMGE